MVVWFVYRTRNQKRTETIVRIKVEGEEEQEQESEHRSVVISRKRIDIQLDNQKT